MDPEFIDYYQRQLTYIQGAFSEFAQEHPKIAARLGAQAGDVRDPHVARLLEAFAWSAARSEQRIDRWPLELPLRILDGIDLNVTAPLPSLGVVRFRPDAAGAHTATGLRLARGTTVTMGQPVDGQSECRFLTTQTFTLWPLSISRVKLTGIPADIPALYRYLRDGQDVRCVRGALRLRLSTHRGTLLSELEALDRLPVYLCGEERMASQLFELLHTSVVGMVMGVPGEFETGELYGIDRPGLPAMRVAYEGLEPDESLVRPVLPKWHGQRLVHDFFALQERFWFFTLTGLAAEGHG
ncbi:type VI secretion system baseplate subunit TssF [Paraburkholderia tropica]|uniref:type VI secretion system baseplate subunit TssF n=1 Tax=Paraburkholderia tropica TaxID=92647 RepID=UPI002AB73EC0|nr:type VI secretion system baseplate subunit TssF [Paraburkholderia tropica]